MVPSASVLAQTELGLEDTMVIYIRHLTQEDRFKVKRTVEDPSHPPNPNPLKWEYGPAAVHAGLLPTNEVGMVLVDLIPVYPFVLCHLTKGKDALPQSLVYTKIIVGMWDDDPQYQGYRDSVLLLRKIVRAIWYWNTLAETYQMEMEEGTEWRVYDSNKVTWPYFLAEARIGWRMRTPIMKAESEDLDFTYPPPPPIILGVREEEDMTTVDLKVPGTPTPPP